MLNVTPIPAFNDNYIWMIQLANSNRVMVVDPGEAAPVIEAIKDAQLTLEGILITHHHGDHTGGIKQLLKQWPVPVFGPKNPKIEGITHRLEEGDQVDVFGEPFSVLEVPGHTLDHIAYISQSKDTPLLFCGDTLFAGGCGRLFEGTAEQMHKSLTKLANLPANTAVFPAHEYTLANLAFARAVEPSNQALLKYQNWCEKQRKQDLPTVPSSIANERAINPFLRSSEATVCTSVTEHCGEKLDNPVAVFRETRAWKDHF